MFVLLLVVKAQLGKLNIKWCITDGLHNPDLHKQWVAGRGPSWPLQDKEGSLFPKEVWWVQIHNTYSRVGRRPKRAENNFTFKFSCLAIKYEFCLIRWNLVTFIYFFFEKNNNKFSLWNFSSPSPNQEIEPGPQQWKRWVLSTAGPRKSPLISFK